MVIKLKTTDVSTDDRPESFAHPERFHDFQYIGGGSFGRVVSAKDSVKNDYEVAIKKISVQRHANARLSDVKNLLREVVILRYAKNPQIVELVSIYMELKNDVEKVPVSIYIVMKYCGVNLVDYMGNLNRLTLAEAADIVYNVARGLNFLHKLEIYHRDLKPNNICIDVNDNRFRAKIIDLGYARKKPQDTNEITSMIATVCYRAPENLFGLKFKEKQDVWSLGCILGYIASSENIFRYMRRELKESSGTLQLILRYLGKPSRNFIENLNENRTSIDRLLWRDFNKLFEASDYDEGGKGFGNFLRRHEDDPKQSQALELMNGMLKWHHEERMSIQDIMESDFVAEYRDQTCEKLPDSELCDMIKDILDDNENGIKEYEIRKDYNGLIQNYLYKYIADEFGYDEDVDDYYSYSSSSE